MNVENLIVHNTRTEPACLQAQSLIVRLGREAADQVKHIEGIKAKAEALQGAHAIAYLVWVTDHAINGMGAEYWFEEGISEVATMTAQVLKCRGAMASRRTLIDLLRVSDRLAETSDREEMKRLETEAECLESDWYMDRQDMFRAVARVIVNDYLPAGVMGV